MGNARPERLKYSIFTLITDSSFSQTGDGNLKNHQEIRHMSKWKRDGVVVPHPSRKELR